MVPLVVRLDTRAVVEGQIAAMLGRTLGSSKGDIFFPLIGGRPHVSRPDGFGMYWDNVHVAAGDSRLDLWCGQQV